GDRARYRGDAHLGDAMVGNEQGTAQAGQLGLLAALLGGELHKEGLQAAQGMGRLELATLALGGLAQGDVVKRLTGFLPPEQAHEAAPCGGSRRRERSLLPR